MQLTIILDIKLQKKSFRKSITNFSSTEVPVLNPPLGWECTYVCQDLRTEKEDIYGKS